MNKIINYIIIMTRAGLPPSRNEKPTCPLPVNCVCVWGGEVRRRHLPLREKMIGPEHAQEGDERPLANTLGNWASIPLAGNAGSVPIGGRSETPS
jgi:hypothetical protein